jgi:hypothetical protein
MAAFTASTSAAVLAAGIAHADRAVPQPGAACGGSVDSSGAMNGAQAFSPQGEVLLCVKGDPVSVWQHLDGIQRPAQIWFTYGPDATSTANDITPGEHWIGFSGSGCTATQTSTTGGPSVVTTVGGGPFTDLRLLPDLDTLKLKGSCTWRKSGPSPYGP